MKEVSDEIKNKACIEFCGKIQAEGCLERGLQSCEVATDYYILVLKYREVIK